VTTWVFEVQVRGEVTDQVLARLRAEFEQVVAFPEPASTLITGSVPDQAALVGMLNHLDALGLEVREMRQLADQVTDGDQSPSRLATED